MCGALRATDGGGGRGFATAERWRGATISRDPSKGSTAVSLPRCNRRDLRCLELDCGAREAPASSSVAGGTRGSEAGLRPLTLRARSGLSLRNGGSCRRLRCLVGDTTLGSCGLDIPAVPVPPVAFVVASFSENECSTRRGVGGDAPLGK